MTDLQKFDAAFAFKKAMLENIEANGLESVMIQFKAIANVYATDFYVNVDVINTHESEYERAN